MLKSTGCNYPERRIDNDLEGKQSKSILLFFRFPGDAEESLTHRDTIVRVQGRSTEFKLGRPHFQTILPTRQSVTVCLPIFAMMDRTESYLMGSGNKAAGMCKLNYTSTAHFMPSGLALYVSLYHPLCYRI